MFYYLSLWAEHWALLAVFKSVGFRAAMSLVTSFGCCVLAAPPFIRFLRAKNIKEDVTKKKSPFLVKNHADKAGTPTMGGLVLMGSALLGMLLWCRLDVLFIVVSLFTLAGLSLVGFFDDYVKLTDHRKDGLSKKEKLGYQFLVGGGVGLILYFYGEPWFTPTINIPFVDPSYAWHIGWLFPVWVALLTTSTSNAVNLTDGLDGLATLCYISAVVALGLIAYFAGHATIAAYLNIPKVPGAQELAIACGALAGACMGFLWFNAFPAEVFMGDTGSLPLGGFLGLAALCIKQELLLALIGGVFVVEALSVMIQVFSFKVFKKRVFLISPLHHHFEKVGWSETKIVTRFFIVSVLLAVFTVAALRIR